MIIFKNAQQVSKTAGHCGFSKSYSNRTKGNLFRTVCSCGFGVLVSCYGSRTVNVGSIQNKPQGTFSHSVQQCASLLC